MTEHWQNGATANGKEIEGRREAERDVSTIDLKVIEKRKNRPDDNIGMRRIFNPGRRQTDGNTVRNNRKITDWAGITVMMTRRCKRKTEDTETVSDADTECERDAASDPDTEGVVERDAANDADKEEGERDGRISLKICRK